MKKKTLIFLSLACSVLLTLGCAEKQEHDITHPADYAAYLAPRTDAALQKCNE